MAVELEGLEFQIETKAEQGVKGIDALTASLGKLRAATKGGLGLGSSVKQLEKLDKALSGFHTEKLEKLGKALESVSKLGEVKISGSIAKQLGGIADVLDRITLADVERLEDMTKALRDLGELSNVKIPKVTVPKTGVTPITDDGTAATASIAPATSEIEQVGSVAQSAGTKIHFFKNSFKELGAFTGLTYPFQQVKSAITSASHGIKQLVGNLKELYGKFKESGGIVGLFARSLKGAAQGSATAFAATIKTVTALLKKSLIPGFKTGTTKAGQFLKSIARIAMYRAIRAMLSAFTKALKEGINNLYQYSNLIGGTFAQSMDRLATSSSYLKNSLGAMAAPIINAIAPAIDFVIDKVVALLNVINMLFARLSGASTFTAAKKNAQSYGDSLAGAGGSAAKAAKEIRDATTGIDELNIIMQKDNAGGGGGAGTDFGSMFEEIPIDNSVSEFADKLKQAFDNSDWKELGTILGNKVNEIVDSIDYSGIGHKIGFGINGAIQTVYYFLDTVNFTNIGTHIAELLNSAFSEIDFTYIGRLMVKGATIIPDMLIGGLMELDWGLVAKSASDILIGLFDEITAWFKKYDWSEIGSTLWQKIKDLLSNIDYAGIASSFFTYLGTALRSAIQFLGGFFGSIGSDIKTWWDNEIAGEDWKQTAKNLLTAIGEGFKDVGNWVMSNIVDPFCNALLGEDVWADVKQAGKDLWDGFTQGVVEPFKNIGTWIKTHIVDPFVQWFKDLFGIHSPSTVMAEIGGYIIEGLLNGILEPFKAIGAWVNENIFQPLKQAFEDSPVVKFAVGVINGAKTWWKNVTDWWSGVSSKGVSLTALVSLAKSGWTSVKSWIGSIPVVSQTISLLKSGWTTVRNWIGNLPTINQTIALLKSGWTSVKTWIGNIPVISQGISLLKSGWTTVKNWIGNIPILSQGISLVKSGWTTVKNWIGSIPTLSQGISLLKSGWTTVKNWIGTLPVISQGISLIKSGWTTVKNWIGTLPIISQGISLLKSGWTSVKSWIGSLPVISQGISLLKSGWTTVKAWINTSTVSVGISLFKSGWSSLSSWIGNSVSVGISLFKSGWSSIKSFFGLADGGILGANGGVKAFSSGGAIKNGFAEMWNNIPKYAGGTPNAHGSMFVAGERGAELVGHVNGRTEVLNKSQLGQVMHRSIVDGMGQFAGYWKAVNTHMTTCTNTLISAMLLSADAVYAGMEPYGSYTQRGIGEWVDSLESRVETALEGVGSTDQIAEGVREGMYDITARQNELLKEQNELLQRLLNKNTTVQIGNKTIKEAVVTQDNADGYRFTK